MSVTVRIPTILRTYTGGRAEVAAEGATLGEVIADLEENHTAIAARVLDDQGKLVAGLSISAPADRLQEEWISDLLSTVNEISAVLGHVPAADGAEPAR